MCGWQLVVRWTLPSRQEAIEQIAKIAHRKSGSLCEQRKEMIDDVITASKEVWDQATDDVNLKESAAIFRQFFLIHRAKHPNPVDHLWDAESPIASELSEDEIEVEHSGRRKTIHDQLQIINRQPSWLCTDECDFVLDVVRRADPDTYYPSPAKWDSFTGEFVPWSGTLLSLSYAKHIVWFVVVEQHWVKLEIVKAELECRVFVTGLPCQQSLCEDFAWAIADLCQIPKDEVITHFWASSPPDGLCGWWLLSSIFASKHLQDPVPLHHTQDVLNASRHRQSIHEGRDEAHRSWKQQGANPELQSFCEKARDLFLVRILEGKVSMLFGHAGAQPDGKDNEAKDAKEAKAKKQVQDPLFINDPWARAHARVQNTRWEDLQIPKDNPFVSTNGTSLAQTHRLQLGSQQAGLILATKKHLAEISKTPGKEDLAVLLPAAEKASFGDAAPHLTGPHEVVLEDPAQKTTYKRLVLMFVVRGDVKYKLKTPEVKCSAADFVELVAEIDCRIIAPTDFQHAKADPVPTFRKLILAICPEASDNLTMYGFRNYKPAMGDKATEQLQIICRTHSVHRQKMLEGSGNFGILLRDFIEKPQANTVLPKFWPATASDLHGMLISTKAIPGSAGAALTRRGLALRVWTTHIAQARAKLMHDDARLTDVNRHVIPVVQFESSGWPTAIEVAEVIKAVNTATGCPPVPTRAYRAAGVHCWSLAFGAAPSKVRFTIDVSGSLHEILLVPSTNRFNPKVTNKQHKAKPPGKNKPTFPKN